MLSEIKDIYLPIIMAFFLAYIAYQQMQTNKSKLKLDLYNKRFDIYASTLKFSQELMSDSLTEETHNTFIEAKQASKFLFDPKNGIFETLEQIHTKAFIVIGYRTASPNLNDPETLLKMNSESQEAMKYIRGEVDSLDQKINEYLKFHK